MAESFVDALIKRLQEKGESVNHLLSSSASPLDRAGAAYDLAMSGVQPYFEATHGALANVLGGIERTAQEAQFGNKAKEQENARRVLSGDLGPYLEALQQIPGAITRPFNPAEVAQNQQHYEENTPELAKGANDLINPLNFLLGKAKAINEAGKTEAVGNLAKTVLGTENVLNNPVARALSKGELAIQLPLTAPVEGAAKLIGGVGKATGLSRLTQRGQATKNLDTASTEVSDLRQKIDAAYADVPAAERPTTADFQSWKTGYQNGDADATAQLQTFLYRLERLQNGETAPAAATIAERPQPRANDGGPIPGQDPLARPALPGEAPAAGEAPSTGILRDSLQSKADAVTAAPQPVLPAARGTAAEVARMDEIIGQFDDWAQRFESTDLKQIADRLRQGGLSAEEKQAYAVVYNVMKKGEGRAPVQAAPQVETNAAHSADATAPETLAPETVSPQIESAPIAPNGATARDQQIAEALGFTPEEVSQLRANGAGEGRPPLPPVNGKPQPKGPPPPPVSEAGLEDATGTVSPETLAANKAAKEERILAREEAAQHLADQFTQQGVSKPSKAAVAKAVGMNPRSIEASQLHAAVVEKLSAAPAAVEDVAAPVAAKLEKVQPVEDTAAAADPRLAKLMKAAKRDGIVDVIEGELEDGNTRLDRIAQQIKSIFPAAKSDEELMAVVQRVAQERSGTASLGAAVGFNQDENGDVQFDPQRAALGAVVGSVAPGNTRIVFKGPVAEELVQALAKRFGAANVTRGAENVLDLKVAGRLTEQALRKFVAQTAQKLGVDLTDALVAHPQGSDIGVLVKGADEKLAAMVRRVAKGATVTPTSEGLQVLLRQTPTGSRGAGTSAQQAAASRALYGKLAEAVKAHGGNPDEVLQAGRPRIEPLTQESASKATPQAGPSSPPAASVTDRISALLQQGGTDTAQLDSLLSKQQAVSTALGKDQQSAQEILGRIQSKVPQPIKTVQEALDNTYAQRVATEDLKQLAALQKKYGFDILDQEQWAEHLPKLTEERLISSYQEGVAPTALDKVSGSAAARYGVPAAALGTIGAVSAEDDDKAKAAGLGAAAGLASASPLGRALGSSLKQILLLSPRYHVNNLTDIAAKSLLNGIKPFLDESTAAAYLRDWGQLTPQAERQLVNLDGGLLQSFKQASKEFHKGVDVNRSVVEGFSKEIGDAPALVRFLKLGKAAQVNRQIATTFERDARIAAYIQGKEQYLQSQLVGFSDRLAQLSPEAATAVRQSGGRMSQAKMAELLDTAGLKGAERGNTLAEWNKLLRAGDQHGADLANTVHFNYRYTTSFDEFMGQLMLFHIYSTRNLVYYPKLLAEHPMVAASIVKLEQQSAEDADKRGLTSRFLGTTPAGEGASKLVSMLFGANGEAFVNPAQYISIVQQTLPLAKQLRSPSSDTSAVGAAVEGARNLGFGLNPIGEIALGAGGALGDTVPASGVLTPLQPITAALRGLQGAGALGPVGGSTIETDPTVGLTSGIIKGLGTNVQDFSQAAIKKRIAEMAIEQGKAPGAYDAEAANPNSPIYQEAVRQVAAQQSVRGGLSYAGGPNLQFLPDSEAEIRAARKGANAPKFNPNANALERATYGQERQKASQAEIQQSLSSPDTFNRTLQTDPQGMARAAQELGADVSQGPDGTLSVTVQGTALRPVEMVEILKQYQLNGGKIGQLSQAYSGVNRDPEQLAKDRGKDRLDTQQILAAYQAATPTQKVAMLKDPNVNFVLSQQRKNYTSPGAYR